MKIYLDLAVILNFLVDFLLLLGTNRLTGFPIGGKRAAAGAALGALYSGACMLPGFSFLGGRLWRLVSLGLMAWISFGWGRSALKRWGVFCLLSMALGGMAANLGVTDIPGLLAAVGLIWLLCRVGFGRDMGGREYVPLEIVYGARKVRLTALRDTGNTLRDPVTGEQVLVIDAKAAEDLTGLTEKQIASPLETMGAIPGLRLIPYRSVGQSGGMLLAMRFRDVRIGDWKGPAVVAFAPQAMGGGFRALTGGAMG